MHQPDRRAFVGSGRRGEARHRTRGRRGTAQLRRRHLVRSQTDPSQEGADQLRTIDRHYADELALLESLDMGKPVTDARNVDVAATIRCMSWTGEALDKIYGEIAATGASELGLVTREPLGVIGAIVPWNFPLLMAAWKIAPALAMGNSVVLKPSEKSPLSAIRLAEIAIEAASGRCVTS